MRLANEGAPAQRLLWASTSVKDPEAPDVLYVEALAAPFTVNTMPDHTLEAFADHGTVGDLLPADGGDADQVIAAFARAGIDPRPWPASCSARERGVRGLLAGPAGPDRRPAQAAFPVSMEHTLITEPDASSAGRQGGRIRGGPDPGRGRGDGAFTCAVSGGQTPWLMLAELARHDLPWSSVEIYQVDERVAADGDPGRNLTHLRQILGSRPVTLVPMPVTVRTWRRRPPPTPAGYPPASTWCTSGWAPTGTPPRWCPATRPGGDGPAGRGHRPLPGPRRMTLTYPALARAEEIMWLVTGASKHDALARLLAATSPFPPPACRPGDR